MRKPVTRRALINPSFNDQTRENWGYWDGKAGRENHCRTPSWAKSWGGSHPFDQQYARGYWVGRNGDQPHPSALAGA